ncbi:MAG: hypothetical protein KDJ14_17680 [Xanthomonadales bacterium]|nr:hypothetical protein [Xanthomonadales bacterium]
MMALLWSQMALALHADCMSVSGAQGMASAVQHADCDEGSDEGNQALCMTHCQDSDRGVDTARAALTVPALLPAEPIAIAVLADAAQPHDAPPARHREGRHRPTAHPASILLI